MSSKWCETGILRKKQARDNFDDLLVFGYACKLFRDDEKAQYIDQGKHLIPWMGDESIKIDRYDSRGALSDLSTCEASKEGYDATRWLGLNESERRIEQLCDEERYYSLHTNEEEEAMYKEEEAKRQQANEFQYSYDVPRNPEEDGSQESVSTCEEEVKLYVPSPELDVPVDINIPKTQKENARIEKTALFVSKQGPQMEILIKAKQADNLQFNFMNQSDPLYKYYRHVLSAIKNGRYKPQSEQEKEDQKEADQLASEEHYLHPSLAKPPAPPSSHPPVQQPTTRLIVCGGRVDSETDCPRWKSVPPLYRPTADCLYTQLVSRIQGKSGVEVAEAALKEEESKALQQQQAAAAAANQEQQAQYYQYYYQQQYYEYYKQITQQYAAHSGCDPQTVLQNPQLQEQIQQQASHYAQADCNRYMQQSQTNPYAQIVTNLAPNIKPSSPPPTPAPPPPAEPPVVAPAAPVVNNPLLSLVHYSDDSEESETELPEPEKPSQEVKSTFKVPPDETSVIIDKMANYVSKNGDDFESIVKAKGDPRFEFLNDGHEYNKYYKHKLDEYKGVTKAVDEKKKNNGGMKEKEKEKNSSKEKKVIAPVSFSIKKPKEESPKEIKSALPVEESDDEDEEAKENSTPIKIEEEAPGAEVPEPKKPPTEVPEKRKVVNGNFLDSDDPILEMIDLTDDLEEKRDLKRAEDKIKDKIASAAKEKLLRNKDKDRALQMDRRKRAAMFLKMKNVEHPYESEPKTRKRDEDGTKSSRRREDEDYKSSRRKRSDEDDGKSRKRGDAKASGKKMSEEDAEDMKYSRKRTDEERKSSGRDNGKSSGSVKTRGKKIYEDESKTIQKLNDEDYKSSRRRDEDVGKSDDYNKSSRKTVESSRKVSDDDYKSRKINDDDYKIRKISDDDYKIRKSSDDDYKIRKSSDDDHKSRKITDDDHYKSSRIKTIEDDYKSSRKSRKRNEDDYKTSKKEHKLIRKSEETEVNERLKKLPDEILNIDSSESEEGEIKSSGSGKKSAGGSSHRKKSHKRKSSRSSASRREPKSRRKRSKKRKRRSSSKLRSSSVSSTGSTL